MCHDVSQSSLLQSPLSDREELVTFYHETLLTLPHKHAPETKKLIPDRPDTAWYNVDVGEVKKVRCHALMQRDISGRVGLKSTSNCSSKPTISVLR